MFFQALDLPERALETPEWLELHFQAKHEFRRQAADIFDIRTGDDILDVGCGTGAWAEFFLNLAGHQGVYYGIDPSTSNIEFATKRMSRSNLLHRLSSFSLGRIEDITESSRAYDVIHFGNSLGYVVEWESIIRLLKSRLRPGGRIIIRQYDDGALLVSPIEETTLCKVKGAVADALSSRTKETYFDHYLGRKLSKKLNSLGYRTLTKHILPFEATASFDQHTNKYVANTCYWMWKASEGFLDESIRSQWLRSTVIQDNGLKLSTGLDYFFEIEYILHLYS